MLLVAACSKWAREACLADCNDGEHRNEMISRLTFAFSFVTFIWTINFAVASLVQTNDDVLKMTDIKYGKSRA